jgi:hypothetical protein
MVKRSKNRKAKTASSEGGIIAAVTQDVELTVEEAEEAAKKVVRAAAAALSITTGQVSAEELALSRKRSRAGKKSAPSRPSKTKGTRKG